MRSKKDISDYKRLSFLDGIELLYAKNHTLDFPNHTHNTFNIALILHQSFSAKLRSKLLNAPIGTICITNPDEVHATPCDKQTGNTFNTFYISPDVLKEINHGKDVFFNDKVIYNQALFNSFYYLSQNVNNPLIDFEKYLLRCLTVLVEEYSTELKFKNCKTQLFHTFLEEETFLKFSLEKTAKGFGLDKYKFLRLFKQETGLTPNSFIINKRIENAKKLISENGSDLLEIAISSGFYDTAHFCRDFKKYTGVTPTAYKNA
ncbi:AraC family transcriptional regulator [Pedobacter nototheniae]|uniref:AraC family transcriptional regulator n=1 Tax=Pedobacter nototheniae TaxID=2488994 RepID=UPI00103E1285|nr:AraC family transcriptional regulator [Pedobacter nototheniae]